MKLSQAKAIAKAAITVKTDTLDCVPYLVSGAGIGKTSIVHEIAKELGIGCQILSLAQYDAGELAGWVLPNADGEMARVSYSLMSYHKHQYPIKTLPHSWSMRDA
mgnify:CR=1 FL=1